MQNSLIEEARRQVDICNACRYCEGFCSVFPAINRERTFTTGDITQLANLCHNCRGCYYACQYTAPHEFDLNLPKVLAQVRQESWQDFAWPSGFAKLFNRSGVAIALAVIAGFALILWLILNLKPAVGDGFYQAMSHNVMVAIFLPAFILPVIAIGVGIGRQWQQTAVNEFRFGDLAAALADAAQMRNLAGGHGEGCNFEDEDRFTNARRAAHHLVMYGFLLCFAATSVATIMHYAFNMPAPYPLLSLPKLFGITGGIMLSLGTIILAWLKAKADRSLSDESVWRGEMGFILLLFFVSTTGLVLYGLGATRWLNELLALHLGSVLAFFLLTPYSKMAHGFYRLAALTVDAAKKRCRAA